MPLTIVHLLAPAHFGGLESVVQLLATGQQARGHQVIVAPIVTQIPHPFVAMMQEEGIEVIPVLNKGRAYHKERSAVAKLLRDVVPHVVHSHGYQPDILDLPVARESGIATVSTLHGFIGGGWKLRAYERLQLRALRACDAVIAVSRGVEARALARGIARKRVHLIPNAYRARPMLSRQAARAELGIPESDFRIAWIGRIQKEKGPDVIINAMQFLRGTKVTLSIIGDGPMRLSLQQHAESLGVGEQITWHNVVPNSARVLPAFDGYVLSSRTEGTPMVLLESMSASVPIVATSVGGVPDMLSPQEAILVPSENPQAIALAILELGDNPAPIRAMTQQALLRLERDFSVERWLDQHEALYESIQR